MSLSARHGLTADLIARLRLPVIAAPMFLVSTVETVIASARSGIIGALPAANARDSQILRDWLGRIGQAMDGLGPQAPPWALNLVVHRSSPRLADDLAICVEHRVPIVITALGSPQAVVQAVHGYGGWVWADVATPQMARKAAATGVDGLVLVCSGAGGHTGAMAAAAFVAEVREFFDGIIVLAGAVMNGAAIRAAQTLGADLVHMGTRFIAVSESAASPDYRQMLIDSNYSDIICTNALTGAWANKLRPSLVKAGLDPDHLVPRAAMDLSSSERDLKAWKDLWSAGHGVAQVRAVRSTAEVVAELLAEYEATLDAQAIDAWAQRRRAAVQPSV